MTGQYAAGAERGLDWAPLAGAQLPIVIYMGMTRLAEIVASLTVSGMPLDRSVAVVCNATTPEQRVLVTTLANVVEDAARAGLGSPSIVAIGEMVQLRAALTPFAITLETGS